MGATPIDDNDADGKSGKLYGWLLIIRCTSTVEPEECLSDSVYYFNKDKDRVEIAA